MALWDDRVSVRIVDEDGEPMARVVFSDVAMTLPPEAVSFANGVLRVAVPTAIDVPAGVVTVERWLPPTVEQVRLAVEALDAAAIERILLRESAASSGEPWGVLARRAVAHALVDYGADG